MEEQALGGVTWLRAEVARLDPKLRVSKAPLFVMICALPHNCGVAKATLVRMNPISNFVRKKVRGMC